MLHAGRGVESDLKEAVTWYRQAGKQGHAAAQYTLARLFLHGEGVEADEEEAAKWFKLAAAQEVPEAQLILADCYLRGRGVPEDFVLAYVWFNRASSHGLEIAEKNKRHTARYMTPDQIAQAQEISRTHLAA
jgi:hypothetical protein